MLNKKSMNLNRKTVTAGLLGVGLLGIIVTFTAASDKDGEPATGSAQAAKPADAQGPAPRVTVLVPGASNVTAAVKVTGTISAKYDMPVGVEGDGGRVAAVLVEAGDRVAKGQVLARLNTDVLRPQVAQLAAALEEARANARLALADYERAKAVAGTGAISNEDVERRKSAAETAAARAKVAEAQLREGEARLARAEVRAPSAGVVLERMVEVGQYATPGSPLFRIAKDGAVELRGEVAEQDLPQLAVGQSATVRITGVDREFNGKIWLLGPTIDPKSRLGTVRVALQPHQLLRPGAFAQGTILAGETRRPVLPHSALQAERGATFVYIVGKDNKVRKQNVRIGTTLPNGVVIAEGLSGNERVVASAGAFLRDGEAITPVQSRAS